MRRAGTEALNDMTRQVGFYHVRLKEAVLLTDGLLRNPVGWDREIHR